MLNFKEWFVNEARRPMALHPEIGKWLNSADKLKQAIDKLKAILKTKEKGHEEKVPNVDNALKSKLKEKPKPEDIKKAKEEEKDKNKKPIPEPKKPEIKQKPEPKEPLPKEKVIKNPKQPD